MTFTTHASARYHGALPDDLIRQCVARLRDADLTVAELDMGLDVILAHARVVLSRSPGGLAVVIKAANAPALQNIRDYLLHLVDQIAPGITEAMIWTGDVTRDSTPFNLHVATVRSVRRVAPKFLRVELDCPGTGRLAAGTGMHFSLLLPPAGRVPVWPWLDSNGRTTWPQGEDSLHRAVYTFVALDPGSGKFTFDVFEHEGGRTTGWARSAKAGEVVGIMGPGSGDLPPGDDLLLAGDETALPAIRRILERSDGSRRGTVLVEVDDDSDIICLPRPKGMTLRWVLRARGETLWDHLRDRPAPNGPSRFVWIAAEQALVRKAKARFRGELAVGPEETYLAYYWVA